MTLNLLDVNALDRHVPQGVLPHFEFVIRLKSLVMPIQSCWFLYFSKIQLEVLHLKHSHLQSSFSCEKLGITDFQFVPAHLQTKQLAEKSRICPLIALDRHWIMGRMIISLG